MKQLDCLGFYSLWVTELWFKPGELWFKSPCSLHSWLYNMWQSPPTPPHLYKGSRGVGGRQGGREGWIPAPAQETIKKWVFIAQSCLTVWDPTDCGPPGSAVHRILQARILEWVAISFSRDSSPPKYRTPVSRIAGRLFTVWATREAQENMIQPLIKEVRVVGWRRDLRNVYTEVALETS